jgi:hypothetical protein
MKYMIQSLSTKNLLAEGQFESLGYYKNEDSRARICLIQ